MSKTAIVENETEARLLAALTALNDAYGEIERLRAAILMAENRLEAAHTGNDEVCRACVDVARSYLQTALKDRS